MKRGDTGPAVNAASRALQNAGFSVPVTNTYGPKMEAAVRDFQRSKGLSPTGVLDDATLAALGLGGKVTQIDFTDEEGSTVVAKPASSSKSAPTQQAQGGKKIFAPKLRNLPPVDADAPADEVPAGDDAKAPSKPPFNYTPMLAGGLVAIGGYIVYKIAKR
jgi:hypothetical protein